MLDIENYRTNNSLFICCVSPTINDIIHTQNSIKYSEQLYTNNIYLKRDIVYDEKDPSTWNSDQLKENIIKLTKHFVDPNILCQDCNGKMLLDIAENEFIRRCQLFNLDGMAAKQFYTKYWSLYVDARTKKRKEKITESQYKKEMRILKELNDNSHCDMDINELTQIVNKDNKIKEIKNKKMLNQNVNNNNIMQVV